METEEPAMVEAPAKEGMGIVVGPEEYLPASPRYVRDGEDDTDDQDMDEDEDVEVPFLAPKDDPITSRTPQDVQAALLSLEGNTATVKDSQVSSSDESVPKLIDLGKEEDAPPPLPPKRVNCPTTLGLDKKITTTAERSPIPPPPFSKGKAGKRTAPVADSEVHIEAKEVPEEQIIYINDDADPSPLNLLERQVDCLLMPPPVDTIPIAQRPPLPPRMDQQPPPPNVLERRRHPSGAVGKKTLQERRKGKPLKLNILTVAKMHTEPAEVHCTQELARLASAVVPLQKLNIQEDTHVRVPKTTSEPKTPTPPPK